MSRTTDAAVIRFTRPVLINGEMVREFFGRYTYALPEGENGPAQLRIITDPRIYPEGGYADFYPADIDYIDETWDEETGETDPDDRQYDDCDIDPRDYDGGEVL